MKRRFVCSSLALLLSLGVGYAALNSGDVHADNNFNGDVRIYHGNTDNLLVWVKDPGNDTMSSTVNKNNMNSVYNKLGTPSKIVSDVSGFNTRQDYKKYFDNKVDAVLDYINDNVHGSEADSLRSEVKNIQSVTDAKLDSASENDLPDIVEEGIYGSDIAAASQKVDNNLSDDVINKTVNGDTSGEPNYLDEDYSENDHNVDDITDMTIGDSGDGTGEVADTGLILGKDVIHHQNQNQNSSSSSNSTSSSTKSSSSSTIKPNMKTSSKNSSSHNSGGNSGGNSTGTSSVGTTNNGNGGQQNVGQFTNDSIHFNSLKALTDYFDNHPDDDVIGDTVTVSNIRNLSRVSGLMFDAGHEDDEDVTTFFGDKAYPEVNEGDTVTVKVKDMKEWPDTVGDDEDYDVTFSDLQEGNGNGSGTSQNQNGTNGSGSSTTSPSTGSGNGSGSGTEGSGPQATTNGAGGNSTLPQTGTVVLGNKGVSALGAMSLASVLAAAMAVEPKKKTE